LARAAHGALAKALFLALGASMIAVTPPGLASGSGPAGTAAAPAPEREVIPGAERLSSEQREAYRKRMAAATSAEEKAKIRAEFAKAAAAAPQVLVGDAARGAKTHSACFSCHGVERYISPVTHFAASMVDAVLRASGLSDLPAAEPKSFKGRPKSVADLRAWVNRRNELLNPKMTPQEVEDVVAYLNATYYKFSQ
jgi:mono/diheme cytochrome c family protein